MNHAVAVDASVAIKWVLTAEVLSEQAEALLLDSLAARRPILAAPHLPSEVSSALYQRTRTRGPLRHISEQEAEEALDTFLSYPVQLVTGADLYREAVLFAMAHRLPSIYDVLYIVAARITDVELWTADQRLLNAVGSAAPWVRPIADYWSP